MVRSQTRDDRCRSHPVARLLVGLAILSLFLIGCGGGDGESDGGLVGVVPGGSVTTSLGPDTPGATIEPPSPTSGPLACPVEDLCPIEVALIEIPLEVTPSSISLDGERAWVASGDDAAIVEVDLGTETVLRTLPVDDVVDVVAGAGSLWAVTYEFSFGPLLRIEPSDGSTLATIGEGLLGGPMAVTVGDDAAWVVLDGYGTVGRIDLAANVISDTLGGTEFAGGRGEVAIVARDGVVWAIDESIGAVERIDASGRTIESVTTDLGYSEEPSGEFMSILSQGPRALTVTDDGVWALADTPNPNDEPNVVGGAGLFLLDPGTGDILRRIDIRIESSFGRPGLAITEDAAWYFNFVDGYPIRFDFATGRETFIRINNGFAVGVVSDGTTVWYAVESFTGDNMVIGVDAAEAAAASAALDG